MPARKSEDDYRYIDYLSAFNQDRNDLRLADVSLSVRGVFLSDDLMAVLNSQIDAEFGVPYNEIIAEEFGGVSLHSCGDIKHNLENVARTKGIIVLNTHETPVTATAVLKGRVAVITGGVRSVMAPNYPGSARDNLATGKEVEEY